MDAIQLSALLATCAPLVHPTTAHALIAVESSHNPYAIGVVGGALERQPRARGEAMATANRLQRQGWDYSVGLAQINQKNFARLGMTPASAFDACTNLRAMQVILGECFERARSTRSSDQSMLQRALSCYYSGNFRTGFEHGYVQRVAKAARTAAHATPAPP